MNPSREYTVIIDEPEWIEAETGLLEKPVQPDLPAPKKKSYQFASVCRAWNSSKYMPHMGSKQFAKACNKWVKAMPVDKIEDSFRWLDTGIDLLPERKLMAQELMLAKLNLFMSSVSDVEAHRMIIGICKHCDNLNATIKINRLKSSTIKEDAGTCCESCLERDLEERGQVKDDH